MRKDEELMQALHIWDYPNKVINIKMCFKLQVVFRKMQIKITMRYIITNPVDNFF